MKLPNLMIIGAQKSGTTWLHYALNKSNHLWGSKPKELNFWMKKNNINLSDLAAYFEEAPDNAKYLFESTPHYFCLPKGDHDIAANIRKYLGDIPLILMLRDPEKRYLSAYTHHMMQERFEQTKEIDELSNDFKMLDLGLYYQILKHYKKYFSQIHIYLYDDLKNDPEALIKKIMNDIGLENDIPSEDLFFRINDKKIKQKKNKIEELPILTEKVKIELRNYYAEEIEKLSQYINRDLSHWLNI